MDELLGEFFGTLVLILLGDGVVAGVLVGKSKAKDAGWLAITAGWAFAVMAGVLPAAIGGIWSLKLTETNFSISAAVGFISILGVAVMNGLLMVSYFNRLRAQGLPLHDAIVQGTDKLIRPVTMTALAAIFGLLPAALSTRIGSQSQRPLAIVVVGGMIATLLLTNLVPVLYSFYGHREPPESARGLAH